MQFPLPPERYDVLLCFCYLERGLWRSMSAALKPGGIILVETKTTAYLEENPDFPKEYCLMRGELLRGFSDLSITHYHEPAGGATASLIAQRPVL